MGILAIRADERVKSVYFTEETISVDLMDGRTITVPLVWYPKLLNATPEQLAKWEICGGGYGIHWEEIDEDLSTEGMLRGAPATKVSMSSEPQLGQRKKGGMLDIGDEDGSHPLFYLPFTKRHYPLHRAVMPLCLLDESRISTMLA